MTPFDGTALLAMLLAFYPVVSPAALRQARAERPEYFAGAALIGHSGDKIQLPDARIFDLIFSVDGPVHLRRWQVIEALPGGEPEAFPLEPGPLTVIDDSTWPAPVPSNTFEALAGGALAELGASDGVLAAAEQTVTAGATAGVLMDAGGTELDDVDAVVAEMAALRDSGELADVIAQAEELSGAIDATDSEYDEAPGEPQMPADPPIPGRDDYTDEEIPPDSRPGPHPPEHDPPRPGGDE